RFTQAPMSTENPAVRSRSMRPGDAKGKSVSCRAPNGRCSSQSITWALSTGRLMKPIGRALFANTHPQPHHSGGAVREGSALQQGLASCGACGRRLRTHYTGRTASPGYHCAGKNIVDGRGIFCLSIGAVQIDDAVARAVLTALAPAGLEAAIAAAERL